MAEADPLTILIGMLLTAIAYYQNDLLLSEETTPKTVPVENILNKYDFIIVGGGSAGIHLSSFFFFLHKKHTRTILYFRCRFSKSFDRKSKLEYFIDRSWWTWK